MNWKRAIATSIAAYALTLVIGTIISIALFPDLALDSAVPLSVWISGMILSVIIAAVATHWYLRGIKGTWKHGLHYGLILIAVSSVLDLALLIPSSIVSGTPDLLTNYYTQPFFWLTLAIIVGTTTLTGHLKKSKR